jgi:hypothetical protein
MADNESVSTEFRDLSTAVVADACLRLNIAVRVAPPGIRPLLPGARVAGRALPARHYGSVDVFLEAMSKSERRSTEAKGPPGALTTRLFRAHQFPEASRATTRRSAVPEPVITDR